MPSSYHRSSNGSGSDDITKYVASIIPAVAFTAALAVFLLRRRRKKARRRMLVEQPYGPQGNDMEAAVPSTELGQTAAHAEGGGIDSRWAIPELGTAQDGGELDSRRVVAELEAGRDGHHPVGHKKSGKR